MEIIKAVILTLESVEIHGSENMSKLLGCINILNQLINESENKDGEEVDNGR